ncbi:MAG: hydrogenase maturation protease [PVC group bacterium]
MSALENSSEIKLRALAGKRVLLLGIGNTGRGDDGAGAILARRLIGRGKAGVIDAGVSPENYLGPVRVYNPDVILLADACRSEKPTGSWSLLGRDELFSVACATHGLSPALVMEFLERETGADVFLLGIEAEKDEWGEDLSHVVKKTLSGLEQLLLPLLPGFL